MRLNHPTRCLFAAAATLCLASCVAPDTRHHVVISVPQQRMAVLDNGALLATFPVSTSKFALGDSPGSLGTPLGEMEVAEKIGGSAPSGAVFKDRRRTGEILPPDAPGRDPIVTRILWLRGREAQNANAYSRYIYIHGTPEERTIGTAGELRLRADAFARCDPALRHRRSRREGHDSKRTTRSIGADSRTVDGRHCCDAAVTRSGGLQTAVLKKGGLESAPPWSRIHGNLPRCCCAVVRENNSMSASTMMRTSSGNRTLGSQSRTFFAFEASPMSRSTSAGRS